MSKYIRCTTMNDKPLILNIDKITSITLERYKMPEDKLQDLFPQNLEIDKVYIQYGEYDNSYVKESIDEIWERIKFCHRAEFHVVVPSFDTVINEEGVK